MNTVTKISEQKSRESTSTGNIRYIGIRGYKAYPRIVRQLRMGTPATEIARQVQEIYGEGKDIQFNSLVRKIKRLRNTLDDDEPNSFDQVKDETLLVLQHVFDVQYDRIKMETATELKIGKLFDTTRQEITLLLKLGTLILEKKELIGVIGPEAQRRKEKEELHQYDPVLQTVLNDPVSSLKTLEAIKFVMTNLVPDVAENGVPTLEEFREWGIIPNSPENLSRDHGKNLNRNVK